MYAHNSSSGEAETGGSWDLLATQSAESVYSRFSGKILCLRKKKWKLRKTPGFVLWPHRHYTQKQTHRPRKVLLCFLKILTFFLAVPVLYNLVCELLTMKSQLLFPLVCICVYFCGLSVVCLQVYLCSKKPEFSLGYGSSGATLFFFLSQSFIDLELANSTSL